ncbi:hypothetical protein XNC3_1520001 [Xenorhabdus nematophila F1]|nr:hypothetical protein XNC3_1520001 [Xenorhabdus nematophila F1]
MVSTRIAGGFMFKKLTLLKLAKAIINNAAFAALFTRRPDKSSTVAN